VNFTGNRLKRVVQVWLRNVLLVFLISTIAACTWLPVSIIPDPIKTSTPTVTQTTTPISLPPTITPTTTPKATQTATVTPIPYDLTVFQSKVLLRDVTPQGYIGDTCEYLNLRWGQDKSKPGTIVVPVMYHSVRQEGKSVSDPMDVTHEYFMNTMQHAKQLGFETITTEQLVGFLKNNESIPPRSMILIVDDRRPGVIRQHFLPVLDANDWTVTLAYITGVAADWEWKELLRLNQNNRLDMQAHGFLHNGSTYFTEFTSPEIVEQELFGPIPLIEQYFGRPPMAFIWPGGNYTPEAIAVAHEAGYEIGFTVHARGPVMFNWIPLGESEIAMNDPLMVLPRYWSNSAYINLDQAVELSIQAEEFAQSNQADEYHWYQLFCPGYADLVPFGPGE
jgi:peptidoglycan/xylan/chitin deacetylase (PgdA/CDA1 family)